MDRHGQFRWRVYAVGHQRAEADLPILHSLAHLQFHGIVVQWDFGTPNNRPFWRRTRVSLKVC